MTAILVHFNRISVLNNQQRLSKDNTLVPTAFVKLIPNFYQQINNISKILVHIIENAVPTI